jgi:hypothetical protein
MLPILPAKTQDLPVVSQQIMRRSELCVAAA